MSWSAAARPVRRLLALACLMLVRAAMGCSKADQCPTLEIKMIHTADRGKIIRESGPLVSHLGKETGRNLVSDRLRGRRATA